ncbi:bifunctional 3,4-dihydroxy-2-butanone-4-phosphate synthase/GTP cyclohydrolase II [Luteipulveratus halotolerans]|uniref:Multifunctional fusion protein n=1 Tax=Luteipulveratus halotolerans TaxID=1631356 RepID=A0A0L6CI41_9MICO|nr:bifunctional 3,4-dihydroxy-2-butanone-4-phosphate synthase/GTP cyclohydrolase II [Luteipulveratus halotolerans]KNX37295.1 GTP cyclohydrolase [Luteipulveratus halotolerans]
MRSTIEQALHALRLGRPVLVLDDEDRENEGDAIVAAQTVTQEWVGWSVRHGSGLICAPMTDAYADRLALPHMVERNEDSLRTAYTVTVDAAQGVTTGISAADRLRTLSVLADPESGPSDVIRPGHVLPLRARDGGVLERPGHTEAAVDLCRLAGLAPVGGIVELVHDDGSMLRAPDVHALGDEHDLPVITIEQLIAWRQRHDRVERVTRTVLPTEHGRFDLIAYVDRLTGSEVLALVSPEGLGKGPVLTRVHSECLTGDALGSLRCDCGPQLQAAMAQVAREGGVVVYVRGHEGRGVGLVDKLRAYALQDSGRDTVDAQLDLGLPVDAREFHTATAVLTDLDVDDVRLLTNNPAKVESVTAAGIRVSDVVPLVVGTGAHNARYLQTKRDRLGHTITSDTTRGAAS